MAAPDLPLKYDAIVLGTGLVESLVAAALARNGHQVLHLDRNDYYGGATAVHSLEAVRRWANVRKTGECHVSAVPPTEASRGDGWPDAYSLLSLSLLDDSVEGIEEVIGMGNPESTQQTEANQARPELSGGQLLTGGDDDTPGEVADAAATYATSASADDHSSSCSNSESSTDFEGRTERIGENEAICAVQTADDVPDAVNKVAPQNIAVVQAAEVVNLPESPVIATVAADGPAVDARETCRSNTLDELLSQSRRFNLDLCPKVLYGVGDMVQLLVSSNVARYCEFQAVSRVLSLLSDRSRRTPCDPAALSAAAPDSFTPPPPKYEPVPCGRSDVFNSRTLSMVEKRVLMKLLTDSAMQTATEQAKPSGASPESDEAEAQELSFGDFLSRKGCSARLVHLLLNSVAMTSPNASVREALANTKKFLASTGRYGPTPFLWPMYGGEISQAFCRVCAVFSGTYVLGRTAQALVVDEANSCLGVICNEGKWLQSRWVIADSSYVPRGLLKPGKVLRRTSRAVLITDRSILPSANTEGSDEITILGIPPSACGVEDPSSAPTMLLELPHKAAVSPKGLYVVHLTCASRMETARQDFQFIMSTVFNLSDGHTRPSKQIPAEQRPRVLWGLFFNLRDFTDHTGCSNSSCSASTFSAGSYCGHCCELPNNVYVSDGLGPEIDYDAAVLRAKALFERLCPGAEFIPPPVEDGEASCGDVDNPETDEFISLSDPAPPSSGGDADAVSSSQAGCEQAEEQHPSELRQQCDVKESCNEPDRKGAAALSGSS